MILTNSLPFLYFSKFFLKISFLLFISFMLSMSSLVTSKTTSNNEALLSLPANFSNLVLRNGNVTCWIALKTSVCSFPPLVVQYIFVKRLIACVIISSRLLLPSPFGPIKIFKFLSNSIVVLSLKLFMFSIVILFNFIFYTISLLTRHD